MRFLVTGGAGFIGRWVVKALLEGGWDHFRFAPQKVVVLDNLSNGRRSNLDSLWSYPNFEGFYQGDLLDGAFLEELFNQYQFDKVLHLAARINVQESIDEPRLVFESDVVGTMNLLEQLRRRMTPLVFMSTCMVYDMATAQKAINEEHPTRCASPYAGAKLAAENMVMSYNRAYGLPATILRPFNTYGPFQKTNGEGGVVAIFLKNILQGQALSIYGDGTQTRDLLFVEDCAEFVLRAAFSDSVDGRILNAGSSADVTINDLALMIAGSKDRIRHVPHIHPQSEIRKLLCDNRLAKRLLGWAPRTCLEKGIAKTFEYICSNETEQEDIAGVPCKKMRMPGHPIDMNNRTEFELNFIVSLESFFDIELDGVIQNR